MEVRRIYIEQVARVAELQASIDALDLHIGELQKTIAVWNDRALRPLPDAARAAVLRLVGRYGDYVEVAQERRRRGASLVRTCAESAEWMLGSLTELGGAAARAGIDTRALAVEIDVEQVRRAAEERTARVFLDEGAFEPDEDLVFLEKLFSSSLGAPRLS